MTIDTYAPCPCGSGKKLKFCKCVEQPQDYEKITRLIEGGQELAALERVNQLLAKTPNTAWLLAVKGELTLSLREVDAFRETAQRFLKLKPDNPLALTMNALSSLLGNEPVENAVRMLADGLAESREGLPAMAMATIEMLCMRLRHSLSAPIRFFWSRLLTELRQKAELEYTPDDLANDNLLAMSGVLLIPSPPGSAWSERCNEVNALISAFRYAQSETKLRSILRDYPDQPGPLTQLLFVQTALLEQDAATATAKKLSGLRNLPEVDRDYFAALALELEKGQPGLRCPTLVRYCEIQSDESAREALSKLGCAELLPDETAGDMKQVMAATVADEVPAKSIYNIYVDKTTSAGKSYRAGAGTLALFGRQTDKPARALAFVFNLPDSAAVFEELISVLAPVADLKDPSEPRNYSYFDILPRSRFTTDNGVVKSLTEDEISEAVADDFLHIPFPATGGVSLLQAVEDEPQRAAVRAVLTHLEGAHHVVGNSGMIALIYQRLQLTQPVFALDEQGKIKARVYLELTRIDIPSLPDPRLYDLFATGLRLGIESLSVHCARELLKRPGSHHPESLRSEALGLMSESATSADESLGLLKQLEDSMLAQGKPVGEVIIRQFSMLNAVGREEEARDLLTSAFAKHPTDPYLINLLQYISQQAHRSGDPSVNDSQLFSRMATRRVESESESGLVLPGQEAGEQGKSKLWLPGS